LRDGGSIKGVMQAFRWKSPRMPLMHYRHEEKSEIIARVHEVGAQFFDEIDNAKLRAAKIAGSAKAVANPWQIEKPAESGPQPKPKKSSKSTG
jgi:hypothetical protein